MRNQISLIASLLLPLTLLAGAVHAQTPGSRICQTPDCLFVENVHSKQGKVKSIGILDTRLHLYIYVPRGTKNFTVGVFDQLDDTLAAQASEFVLYAPDGTVVQHLDKPTHGNWADYPVDTAGEWGIWRLSVTGPENLVAEKGKANFGKARNYFMARTVGDVDLYLKPEPSARVRGLRLTVPHFGGEAIHRLWVQNLDWPRLRFLLLHRGGPEAEQMKFGMNGLESAGQRQFLSADDRLAKPLTLGTVSFDVTGDKPGNAVLPLSVSNVRDEYGLGMEQEARLFCTASPLMPVPRSVPVRVQDGAESLSARIDITSAQTGNEKNVAYATAGGEQRVSALPGVAYRAQVSHGFEWLESDVEFSADTPQISVALTRRMTRPKGWSVGDSHCHTWLYDGTDSPAQMAEAARAAGLDWLVITEHGHSDSIERVETVNNETASLKARDDFFVMPGMEYTGPSFHANTLGAAVHVPSGASLQQVVEAAEAADTAAIPVTAVLNHPSLGKTAADIGRNTPVLPLIELWNSTEPAATKLWWELLNAGHHTYALAASDSHNRNKRPPGLARTYVHLGDEKPGPAAVVRALREGRSVLSRGAFIDWSLGEQTSGATIDKAVAGDELELHIEAQSARPMDRIEIIKNGEVLRRFNLNGKTHFTVTEKLPATAGWYLVQALEQTGEMPLALTNPIWAK